jgi:hypothetical protein
MDRALALKERYACGARAAFALMRMIGHDVAYDTVRDHVPPSERGSSLDDVRSALQAHDVECSLRRLQLTDLPSAHYPLIVHVNHRRRLDVGHFFLVTGADKVGLHTYDPVTGLKRHWRWRSFADVWSGYAIVPLQATIENDETLVPYMLGIHLLLVICVVAALGRSMWAWRMNSAMNLRFVIAVFVMLNSGLLYPTGAAAEEIIRSNLYDGANAAALLGGIYGVEIPPGDAGCFGRCDTLSTIQSRLQAYGVASSIRFLCYNELDSLKRPCIVPLRKSDKVKTTFCVLVQVSGSEVYLVEAGPLILRTLSVDEFRRYWTGYAVFGDVADTAYSELLGAALLGAGSPVAVYAMIFLVRRSYGRRLLRIDLPK